MPELPEVETVARGLQMAVAGRRIVSVTLGKTDFIDDPAALEEHLPGRSIERVERFGKFMLMRLSKEAPGRGPDGELGDASLLVHLGMTGHLAPHNAGEPSAKHTHVRFLLDDGRELRYTDARRFGRMAYLAAENLPAELGRFGADPLEITEQQFADLLRARNRELKLCCWIKAPCAASAIFTLTKVCGARGLIRCASPQTFPPPSHANCEKRCKQSCVQPSRCAVLPSAIFLTREASPENISAAIALMAGKGKVAIAARRQSGA